MYFEGPVLDDGNKVIKWNDLTWKQKFMPIQTKLAFPQLLKIKSNLPKVILRTDKDVFHISLEEVKKHLESKIREEVKDDSGEESVEDPVQNPGDVEYVIEDMVGFVKAGGQMRIICKWKDYDDSENTNETFENLANSMFMVKKFIREQFKKEAYCVRMVDSPNYQWEEKFLKENLQFIEPSRIVLFDATNDWVVMEWKNTPDLTFHTRKEAEKRFLKLLIQFFKRNMDSFIRGIIREPKLPNTMFDSSFYEKYQNSKNE